MWLESISDTPRRNDVRQTGEVTKILPKLIIGAAAAVTAVAVLRRFGPAVHAWAMGKCQEMFEHMPEEFLPKRMMRGIEELREQNARILRNLDEEPAALAAAPEGR